MDVLIAFEPGGDILILVFTDMYVRLSIRFILRQSTAGGLKLSHVHNFC